MQTIYVSDLDGTLLNSDQRLSNTTIDIINDLIEKGMHFSIATARSIESAERIIEPINFKLPIILHNGVFIYDPIKKKNILSNYLENEIVHEIYEIFIEFGISPIIFTRNENEESKVFFKDIFNYGEEHYIKGKLNQNDKRFTQANDLSKCLNQKIITILGIGTNENLEPAYKIVEEKYEITCHYTEDIYSKANWLELSHSSANKRDSVKYLKDSWGFERLICFGDNLNDTSMFEIADEKYAVRNAHDLLKGMATKIIGCNNEDGVAKYLENTFMSVDIA